MSTFGEVSLEFENMRKSLRNNVRSVLFEESKKILSDLNNRSPEDTGYFKSMWRIKLSKYNSSNTIASISISNATPYAFFMEYGAKKYAPPWFYPNRVLRGKFKGRFRKGTGKLKESDGRIWAGGLKPGHSKTIGGIVEPAISASKDRLAKAFAEGLF